MCSLSPSNRFIPDRRWLRSQPPSWISLSYGRFIYDRRRWLVHNLHLGSHPYLVDWHPTEEDNWLTTFILVSSPSDRLILGRRWLYFHTFTLGLTFIRSIDTRSKVVVFLHHLGSHSHLANWHSDEEDGCVLIASSWISLLSGWLILSRRWLCSHTFTLDHTSIRSAHTWPRKMVAFSYLYLGSHSYLATWQLVDKDGSFSTSISFGFHSHFIRVSLPSYLDSTSTFIQVPLNNRLFTVWFYLTTDFHSSVPLNNRLSIVRFQTTTSFP